MSLQHSPFHKFTWDYICVKDLNAINIIDFTNVQNSFQHINERQNLKWNIISRHSLYLFINPRDTFKKTIISNGMNVHDKNVEKLRILIGFHAAFYAFFIPYNCLNMPSNILFFNFTFNITWALIGVPIRD